MAVNESRLSGLLETSSLGMNLPCPKPGTRQYRILCVGETWRGSDAQAAFMAFRRLGHSVHVIDENNYIPTFWQTRISRGLRKVFRPLLVKELSHATLAAARRFRPHCLFVFKGSWMHPDTIAFCRSRDIVTFNFYPDVTFRAFGHYLPRALPLYDHIFNTKTFGVNDMRRQLGVTNVSFLEHGYDPELHYPMELTDEDRAMYECDLTFIGTWQPRNEALLAYVKAALPQLRIKVWGSQWERATTPVLRDSVMRSAVTGDEYTKALCGASICLGLLRDQLEGASSADLITARTFQIPACRKFMLHERNEESVSYFRENEEAAFFATPEELAVKVRYYIEHSEERETVAQNGFQRSRRDGYSIDDRMKVVIQSLSDRLEHNSI